MFTFADSLQYYFAVRNATPTTTVDQYRLEHFTAYTLDHPHPPIGLGLGRSPLHHIYYLDGCA